LFSTPALANAETELAKYAPKYYEIVFTNTLTSDSNTDVGTTLSTSFADVTPEGIDWIDGSKIYKGKNSSVKLGSSSVVGYFTLELSNKNYYIHSVIVNAAKFGSDLCTKRCINPDNKEAK